MNEKQLKKLNEIYTNQCNENQLPYYTIIDWKNDFGSDFEGYDSFYVNDEGYICVI